MKNDSLLFWAAFLVGAVIVGCGPPPRADDSAQAGNPRRQLDAATFNAGLDPSDQRIVALVAWLKRKGVTLEYAKGKGGGGWWKVVQPKRSDEYEVVFSIRSFPIWASEAQMREALKVNLAYMLNAPAQLAMSYGGINGTHPEAVMPKSDDELPKVNGLPVTKAVEKLFREYNAR